MEFNEIAQLIALALLVIVIAFPLAKEMAKIYVGEKHLLTKPLSWLESSIYKMSGINPTLEMTWKSYATALLVFNIFGFLLLMTIQITQSHLPLNPSGLANVPFWLAFNTSISFVTNTNWQAYSGEATMSYFTQMIGLGVQNFVSAATGMAVAVALARGLSRSSSPHLGNFWVDLTRSVVYILLPLSFIFAILLVGQGVIQNFSESVTLTTLEGASQTLPMGPVASQVAIKQLGTNGGGFFGVNSAHPFENPTPISNFLQIFGILLIPVAMPLAFGRLINNKKHGNALLATMAVLFFGFLALAFWSEFSSATYMSLQSPMEGKEMRFGVMSSTLWSMATTATSNGSVNAMISSLSPLAGGLAMLNMMLGEVVFGGVGCGLYGMILFAILSVFIAGLMVGRTPEYLGKRIEANEIKYAVFAVVAPCVLILAGAAIAIQSPLGLSSLSAKGPHGLTEMIYAFSSAAGNNGSAFAGLNANTNFLNIALGICMVLGRYLIIIPVLALAGSMAQKKTAPISSGTFPTDGPLFVALTIGVISIVGALTFLPALSLGPIMEHFLMLSGTSF